MNPFDHAKKLALLAAAVVFVAGYYTGLWLGREAPAPQEARVVERVRVDTTEVDRLRRELAERDRRLAMVGTTEEKYRPPAPGCPAGPPALASRVSTFRLDLSEKASTLKLDDTVARASRASVETERVTAQPFVPRLLVHAGPAWSRLKAMPDGAAVAASLRVSERWWVTGQALGELTDAGPEGRVVLMIGRAFK